MPYLPLHLRSQLYFHQQDGKPQLPPRSWRNPQREFFWELEERNSAAEHELKLECAGYGIACCGCSWRAPEEVLDGSAPRSWWEWGHEPKLWGVEGKRDERGLYASLSYGFTGMNALYIALGLFIWDFSLGSLESVKPIELGSQEC